MKKRILSRNRIRYDFGKVTFTINSYLEDILNGGFVTIKFKKKKK